ncbi:restriction endonuclease subunit S [Clostridium sp.]|uniref:restriction endonuclease subunit S n=1 Tax=Clostridium sp. TaxID=1506 RepID=UPI0032162176
MTYKRYEKYKDSGSEWIGEIPEHWKAEKLKYIVRTTKGFAFKSESFRDDGIAIIKTTDIKEGSIVNPITFISDNQFEEYKSVMLKENDIVMSTVGSKPEIVNSAVGQLGLVCRKYSGSLLNQNAVILRPTKANILNKLLFYYLTSNNYRKYLDLNAHGTANQSSLTLKEILDFKILIPDIIEQTQIANFLDKKTSEIDSLIQDKVNLIELLKEERQAIITEAVTKGLDKNVKMKDSGVKWIGYIPEGWRITKVKHISNINSVSLSENTDEEFLFKYIDIGSVNSYGEISDLEQLEFGKSPSRARRVVRSGDTLVSTVRTYLRAITSFDVVSTDTICSTGFAVLSPKANIESKYLGFLMRSTKYIDEIVSRSTGVSYPAIASTQIGDLECILPCCDEQKIIIIKIEDELSKIDSLISDIVISINSLKEYKQSLISEAVTGKIDVRNII